MIINDKYLNFFNNLAQANMANLNLDSCRDTTNLCFFLNMFELILLEFFSLIQVAYENI